VGRAQDWQNPETPVETINWLEATARGWNQNPPPKITYKDYRQFAESEFQALLKAWLRMSQNRATGDGGTCYGDSGGPAFWTEPDESEILVGITSWGDVPCVPSAFNYRVDIRHAGFHRRRN